MMDNATFEFIRELSAWLGFFSVLTFLFIFPPIFKFIIIPRIEKRVGEKLQYKASIYRWQVFARWFFPAMDIGATIVLRYLIWKIAKRVPPSNPRNQSALKLVNYDVRQASRFEIIMGFLATLNMWIFGLILITHLIFPKYV